MNIKHASFSLVLVALTAFSSPAALLAQEQSGGDTGQGGYVVKEGDTLWDISGSHLNDPRLWPDVWKANPEIKDPDLIYPGEKILLPSGTAAGKGGVTQPGQAGQAAASGDEPFVEMGKTVLIKPTTNESKIISLDQAPPRVPVAPEPSVIAAGFIMPDNSATYAIVGSPVNEKQVFSAGDQVYIEPASNLREGDRLISYREIEGIGNLGTLIQVTGVLIVGQWKGEVISATIDKSFMDINREDSLTNYRTPELVYEPVPANPALKGQWGYVAAATDNKLLSSLEGIIYIDMGSDKGVRPGDRFTVRRSGGDGGFLAEYTFPDIEVGEAQVISVEAGSATARVASFKEAILPGYRVYYKD